MAGASGHLFAAFDRLQDQVVVAKLDQVIHFLVVTVEMRLFVGDELLEQFFGNRILIFRALVRPAVVVAGAVVSICVAKASISLTS